MKYLGIDYGTKKIGVAVSDETGSVAFPHPYYGSEGTAEAFAFHPVGAIFAFGDGSVHIIASTIGIREFARLVTRQGGEAQQIP